MKIAYRAFTNELLSWRILVIGSLATGAAITFAVLPFTNRTNLYWSEFAHLISFGSSLLSYGVNGMITLMVVANLQSTATLESISRHGNSRSWLAKHFRNEFLPRVAANLLVAYGILAGLLLALTPTSFSFENSWGDSSFAVVMLFPSGEPQPYQLLPVQHVLSWAASQLALATLGYLVMASTFLRSQNPRALQVIAGSMILLVISPSILLWPIGSYTYLPSMGFISDPWTSQADTGSWWTGLATILFASLVVLATFVRSDFRKLEQAAGPSERKWLPATVAVLVSLVFFFSARWHYMDLDDYSQRFNLFLAGRSFSVFSTHLTAFTIMAMAAGYARYRFKTQLFWAIAAAFGIPLVALFWFFEVKGSAAPSLLGFTSATDAINVLGFFVISALLHWAFFANFYKLLRLKMSTPAAITVFLLLEAITWAIPQELSLGNPFAMNMTLLPDQFINQRIVGLLTVAAAAGLATVMQVFATKISKRSTVTKAAIG